MKTLDEFVQLFAEQFEETEQNQFTPSTDFRSLDEWSSLIGLSIIAMVDEEFGIALNAKDFRQVTTINDLYSIICGKINES